MPKMYDADDIVDLKNRKKRRKRLLRFLIFLTLVGIAATLYATREKWLGKLRGIGKQARTIVNSGRLAEGNFPIDISSEGDYQLKFTEKQIVFISDTYTFYYDTEGNLLKKRQHAYTNQVLEAAGGRALIYEQGGDEISVEDEEAVIFTKKYDDNILFAKISENGNSAVVTTSANYSCEITVYDRKGTVIYERKCVEMVSDLSFTDGGKGCVLSYITAENGQLVTSLKLLSFSESGEKWTSPGLNTLGLNVFGYDSGAFVLGFDACGYVDSSGQISSYYQYDGDLKGGSSEDGKSAVVINNEDRRKYITALFPGNSSEPLIIEMNEPTVDVLVSDGLAYVLCQGEIMAYDFSGKLRSTADIADSYTGFVRSSDHIFLKGYNRIDRIDYES